MMFSIIVPVAPDRNAPVLDSIDELDYAKDQYEVIVKKGLNPSINRNTSIEKSTGEILAFVDDDAHVNFDWLSQAQDFFNRHPDIDIVGGPQLTPPDNKMFVRLSGYVFSSFFGAYKMASRYRSGRENLNANEFNLTSANLFVRKGVFDRIAAFNPKLFPNEEAEFLHRAKASGLKIAYYPDVVVFHKRRDNLPAFLKQSFGYGKGRARQNKITKSLPEAGVLIPVGFIVYLLLLPILFFLTPVALLPLLAYLAISLANAIWISARNKDILVMVSYPFLCFLNHCAYSIGYLYEITAGVSANNRKKDALI